MNKLSFVEYYCTICNESHNSTIIVPQTTIKVKSYQKCPKCDNDMIVVLC